MTGSSGRIGGALVRALRDANHDVRGLDLLPAPTTDALGDVADPEWCRAFLSGCDALVHTASLHAPDLATRAREDFVRVNDEGTRRLFTLGAASGVGRVLYTSTTSVYGSAMDRPGRAVWVDELLEPEPRDAYDETKLAAEAHGARLSAASGAAVTVLRVARCFPEPFAELVLHRLSRGVDLRDVVSAHHLALKRTGGFATYNISARSPFRRDDLDELARDPAAVLARRDPGLATSLRAAGIELPSSIGRVYVIDRAAAELGYEPLFNAQSLLSSSGADRRTCGPADD